LAVFAHSRYDVYPSHEYMAHGADPERGRHPHSSTMPSEDVTPVNTLNSMAQ